MPDYNTLTPSQRQMLVVRIKHLRADLRVLQHALEVNDDLSDFNAHSRYDSARHYWDGIAETLQPVSIKD